MRTYFCHLFGFFEVEGDPRKKAGQATMARERIVGWTEVAYINISIGLPIYGSVV